MEGDVETLCCPPPCLSTKLDGRNFSSWSKKRGDGVSIRFQRTLPVTRAVLEPLLHGAYSTELYGGRGRVPLRSLRVVWLSLLSRQALHAISTSAGVCKWESKPPLHPFYSVHDMHVNPLNAMWIHPPSGLAPTPRLPNHSWVEVVHCARDQRRLKGGASHA